MRIAMLGLKGIPATYGGVERYTEEIAAGLASRGHEVLVYCRTHYTPPDVARDVYRGVRLIRLPSLRLPVTDTLSHTLLATLDVMRRRVDVVIYHSLGNALFTALPRMVGIPTSLVLHGQEWRADKWSGMGRLFFRASEHASYMLASRVCVIARWLQDDLWARYGRETVFMSTGVHLPEVQPSHHLRALELSPREYLLYVGRLVPEKGVDRLLQAYSTLAPAMPLVIVGDAPRNGTHLAYLRSLATPGVRFLGFRYGEDLATLYNNAYVYVQPSATEGIALTLLEALAHGNCVVASDIPQNREAAAPVGLMYRSGDTEDLARVLEMLIQRPDLVAERRAHARAHVERHYSWEAVTSRYEQLCSDLLSGTRLVESMSVWEQ